ncbi:hypothetical protein GDO86_017446 [Hymenochirus boettgeri]|uniref:Uncharacterized protein n=1 Tax=Hymenochirus boettgeri TaxID=247094 RepID=A0A8T2IQH0_9PIPI|nr:hypothetical protein GDO86_017446 [Hymenochirus boettgeri]
MPFTLVHKEVPAYQYVFGISLGGRLTKSTFLPASKELISCLSHFILPMAMAYVKNPCICHKGIIQSVCSKACKLRCVLFVFLSKQWHYVKTAV